MHAPTFPDSQREQPSGSLKRVVRMELKRSHMGVWVWGRLESSAYAAIAIRCKQLRTCTRHILPLELPISIFMAMHWFKKPKSFQYTSRKSHQVHSIASRP